MSHPVAAVRRTRYFASYDMGASPVHICTSPRKVTILPGLVLADEGNSPNLKKNVIIFLLPLLYFLVFVEPLHSSVPPQSR